MFASLGRRGLGDPRWVGERLPRVVGRATAGQGTRVRCRDGGTVGGHVGPVAPGRCRPARRCVITPGTCAWRGWCRPACAGDVGGRDQVAVPAEPAVRAGETPARRLGHPPWQAGQVEEVPRSSTSTKSIPAASALSLRARIRCPTRQSRVRWLCRRPALRSSTPRGSPTASVPTRAPRPRRRRLGGLVLGLADPPPVPGLGHALARRYFRHRRDPRCPGFGARRAAARVRLLRSRRCMAALGADRPPRHQQPLPVRSRDRVRVDDAQIHPRHPRRIRALPGG